MKQPKKTQSKTETLPAEVMTANEKHVDTLESVAVTWGMMKPEEGSMIQFVDRDGAKANLTAIATTYAKKLDVWKKKKNITEADMELVDKERLEVRRVRLIPQGLEKNNNDIINKVKKRLTLENEELIKIPQDVETEYETFIADQKERIAKAAEELAKAIKGEIESMETTLKSTIIAATLANFDGVKLNIEKTLQEYADNERYGSHEVMLEFASDRVRDAIDVYKKELDQAEVKRIGSIEAQIATIESETNKVILSTTYATLAKDEKRINEILCAEYDYQELKPNFDKMQADVLASFEKSKTAQETFEESRQELNTLKRGKVLLQKDFIELENGDFTMPVLEETLVYTKGFIATDNDEVFAATIEKFEFLKPKEIAPADEPTIKEKPISNFEAAISDAAESSELENIIGLDKASEADFSAETTIEEGKVTSVKTYSYGGDLGPAYTFAYLGQPKTVGELKQMIDKIPDFVEFNHGLQADQYLHVMQSTKTGESLLVFDTEKHDE